MLFCYQVIILEEAALASQGDNRNSSILSDDGTSLMFEELENLKKKFSELKAHSSELNQVINILGLLNVIIPHLHFTSS